VWDVVRTAATHALLAQISGVDPKQHHVAEQSDSNNDTIELLLLRLCNSNNIDGALFVSRVLLLIARQRYFFFSNLFSKS